MMGVDHEEVQGVNIRVFEWEQKLSKVSDSQGLYMFRVYTDVKKKVVNEDGTTGVEEVIEYLEKSFVNVFELESLLSTDSMESFSRRVTVDSQIFKKDTTALVLAQLMSVYLNNSFYFTMQNLLRPTKPKIVIVVDVYMLKFFDNIRGGTVSTITYPLEDGSEVIEQEEIAELSDAAADSRASQVQEEQELTDDILYALKGFLDEPTEIHEPKVLKQIEAAVDACPVCLHRHLTGKMAAMTLCVPPAPADVCPICLQGFLTGMVVAMTQCSHAFHRDCLFQWLPKNNSCPMCRSLCTRITLYTIVYL